MIKTNKIYLAGAGGLLGSAFLRRFKKDGYENIIAPSHESLELINQGAVTSFFAKEKPDIVIMAAGRVGGIVVNRDYPADMIWQNLAMQTNVIKSAFDNGVKKLVFFGSSCMYPKKCKQPMKEDYLLTGKPEPTSIAYATAKMAGVEMCLSLNRQYGKNRFLPVIPNTLYGPGDNFDPASSHVIPAMIRKFFEAKENDVKSVQLWGTGSPRREAVYADDVADAVMFILGQSADDLSFPMNIGTGTDYSIKELATIVASVIGYEGEIEFDISKPDGAPQKLLDSGRILQAGWVSPDTKLETGIKNTYRWFIENREMLG